MIAIRNYNDTKNELEVAQLRLNYLLDKKEDLYVKYCGMTIPKLDDVRVQTSTVNKDTMAKYMEELTKINPNTGLSLDQEIEQQYNVVSKLKYYLNLMDYNLKNMKALEYKLYYFIVIDGRGITSGVNHLANVTNKDPRTIWKYYYPKIEKEIKKLEYVH